MARKWRKFEVGDVFSIPLADDRVAYGQIVASYGQSGGHFYFAIFGGLFPRKAEPDIDAVVAAPVVLLALSMDALLQHGHWKVVRNVDVGESRFRWPAYKEGVYPPGTYEVVDHTDTRRRPANPAEVERLPYRTIVAPIGVEKALRALHGEEPWEDEYDELRPVPGDATSTALFPGFWARIRKRLRVHRSA
jgi:hypothetical protein